MYCSKCGYGSSVCKLVDRCPQCGNKDTSLFRKDSGTVIQQVHIPAAVAAMGSEPDAPSNKFQAIKKTRRG